ncbi:hypothetical protein B0I35DRAFT_498921 [Stachybotrys elegans]|uniref:Rhodopsin domain-containing protein n=1 Tax=Stachybotrys elegans TaxID=80388 RepID=A0A8K0WUB7_9HYPO|nr:hypothetical protein B0I35DRAFT_498921 [Stachybotrys elegans]
MPFNLFQNSQHGAAFVLSIVTNVVCTVATILRIQSTRRARRQIGLEDGFAVAALVFHLVFASMFIWVVVQLNGRSYEQVALDSPADLAHILQVGYIMSAQYPGNQLFSKLSLLALYHRLFSVNRTFNRWLQGLATLQILWFIGTSTTKYLLCYPVRRIWDLTADGSCINIGAFLAATESVNSLIDFAMIGLAVWIISTLQMSKSTKRKLNILFSIGSLSGIIGFVKIGEAYTSAYANQLSGIWDVVQMATSIICCCAPVYKSALPRFGIFKALRSTFGYSSSAAHTDFSAQNATSVASSGTANKVRSKNRDEDETWLRLDDNSRKDLAWSSKVEAGPYPHDVHQGHNGSDQAITYPMRTFEVRQSIERL